MSVRYSNILFPTDFSGLSAQAADCAKEFVSTFGAQLHCLHIEDEAYQYWSGLGPESIPVGPPPEELLELGQKRLQQFTAEHLGGIDPSPITDVRIGRPFSEIVVYAREKAIDLIIMATHGRGGLAHVLLGSTTERVVRKSACPVLTVPAGQREFTLP